MQTVRYNGYPAMRIARRRRAGLQHRRGDGRDGAAGRAAAAGLRLRVDRPVARGKARRRAGARSCYGFSMLAVFLCLAALYESWSIPLAVILVVPLGVLGRAARRRCCAAMPNDVYFKVGLITIIGLSAKNAILIIEFAKDLQAQGKGVIEAALAGGAPALPADPDDLARLHPRRAAAGARHGRRLGEPARHRHRRDGRHDHRAPCSRCSSCRCSSWWCAASSRAASASARCTRTSSRRRSAVEAAPSDEDMSARASHARLALRAGRGAAAGRLLRCIPTYERPAAPVPAAFRGAQPPTAGQPPAADIALAATSSPMRGCSALIETGAGEQPRPARGGAQHRAGARAVPDPARRRCCPTVGVGAAARAQRPAAGRRRRAEQRTAVGLASPATSSTSSAACAA